MLIIEGPDLVGKTTLANAALELLLKKHDAGPYTYEHLSRLPAHWHYYWSYVRRMRRCVVQDRFHMSELVYGTLTRGETCLTPQWYRIVDAAVRLHGGFTVLCYDASGGDVIKSLYEARAAVEMYRLDDVLRVNEMYARVAERRDEYSWVDVDYVIPVVAGASLWPSSCADEVCARYMRLQDKLHDIATTRGSREETCFGPVY